MNRDAETPGKRRHGMLDAVTLDIRIDDLSSAATRQLIGIHLAGMYDTSPAESVHALGIDELTSPDITVWSAWQGEDLVGIGALHQHDPLNGELKSMRVAEAFRGTGAGRAILRHILESARIRGIHTLWLETGSEDYFAPARALYASEGFAECGPFGRYLPDPNSTFMTRTL